MIQKSIIIFAILILIIMTARVDAQSLTWLGTLGGETSIAYSVSDSGNVVVGFSENNSGNSRAFIWTPGSGIQNLTNLQNTNSWASYVSPNGNTVIGTANTINGINYQAIKWTNDGVIVYLGTLGGSGSFNNSEGYSSTSDGLTVVGTAAATNNVRHAFKWSATTGMEDLGTFDNEPNRFSVAKGISDDASIIVGHSEYGGSYTRPCYWLNGTIQELLTSLPTSIEQGEVNSVSPNGIYICGWIDDSTTFSDRHAYLWNLPSSAGLDIGLLPGVVPDDGESVAFDVNDNRQVVGTATDTLYEDNAFYWYQGVMENLNLSYAGIIPFGSKLTSAYSISNNGRYIVGQGYNSTTNRNEAFLLDRGQTTSVNSELISPSGYSLEQNYPNPFNPSTKIRYSIPSVIASETKQSANVSLKVYDVLGNEVATLVNEEKPAGTYEVTFDASKLSSGIYFYKLTAGNYTATRKMILVK